MLVKKTILLGMLVAIVHSVGLLHAEELPAFELPHAGLYP